MRRTYLVVSCDYCGGEVDDDLGRVSMVAQCSQETPQELKDRFKKMKADDVCLECADKVNAFIDGLRPEKREIPTAKKRVKK